MIINLPKLGPVRFDDDLTPEQLDAEVGRLSKKYGFSIPKPDLGLGTIAARGFKRGMGELGIATTDTIPAIVGSSLGFDDYARKQMGEAQEARAKLEAENPTRFKSYQDVGSVGDGAEFVAETLGELGPTALGAIVPGLGAGAIGARVAGQAALKEATKRGLGEVAARTAATQAAQKTGKRAMYGGVYFGSAAQNIPEVFEGIYRETDKLEPGLAALAGGISSALDAIVPGQVMNQLGLFGRQKLVAEVAKRTGASPKVWKALTAGALKTAATEGLTESAQEAIGATAERIAGSAKDIFHPENVQRYKEAFVKGAIGGGAFGVVGSAGQQVGVGQAKRERLNEIRAARAERDRANEQAMAEQQAYQEGFNGGLGGTGAAPAAEVDPSSIAQQRADREQALTEGFAKAPELETMLAEVDIARQQQSQLPPGDPRIQAYQEVIDAGQQRIQQTFGRQNVVPEPSLKVTPEVMKALGVDPKNKFSRFVVGKDLSNPVALTRIMRAVEAPGPNDPQFAGNAAVEAAYNRLISSAPQDLVTKIRQDIGVKTTTEQPAIPDVAPVPEPIQIQEPTVRQPEAATEMQQAAEPEFDESLLTQEMTSFPVQSLDDLRYVDPTDPSEVADVLRFGDQVTDPMVQRQLNSWANQNVPREVMLEALAQTSETQEQMTQEPTPMPDANSAAQVEQAIQQAEQPQPQVRRSIKPEVQETQAQKAPAPADPVDALLVGEHAKGTPEKSAFAYFDSYDPKLAMMSVAHDLVNQPEVYGRSSPMYGQGGKHAKAAEQWIRKNLPEKQVKEFDSYITEAKRQSEESETQYVKDVNQKPKPKPKPKADKLSETPREKKLTLDELLKRSVDNFDIRKPLKADARKAIHTAKASELVQKRLEFGDLQGALGNIDSPIAGKLHPHLKGVKVNTGAKESSFDPATNTIHLRKNATEYEILHEATHAAVSHVIANKNHYATKQLQKLFEQAQKRLDPAYGTQNLQEFVAEAWSDGAFRDQLDSIRDTSGPQNMSLWDSLINILRRLFGLPPRKNVSVLDSVDAMLDEIVSAPPETRTGETLYAKSINDPKIVDKVHGYVDNLIKQAPLMNEDRATTFWANLEKLTTKGKALAYKTLNLSALGQVATKAFGRTGIKYSDTVNAMSGYQENLQERMFPLHNRLQKFAKDARYQEWSTLVHDSTKVDVDPSAPRSKYAKDKEKAAEWAKLNQRYNKMTPDMQKLYKDLFAAYKKLNEETLASLQSNLEDTIGDKELARSTYKKLLAELAEVNIDHYAPLYRRGIYRLDYTKDGDRVQEFHTTQAERTAARAKAQKAGAKDFDEYTTSDALTMNSIPDGTVLSNLVNIMKGEGVGKEGIEKVANLLAKVMPETSMWKHRMRREGVSGYIDDAALAFDNVTSSTVHQLSRVKYLGQMNKLLADMAEQTNMKRGPEQEKARILLEEFKARHTFAVNPNISDFAQLASTGSFFYFLAGNVSSAVVNMLQMPLIVGPQLGGEYGYRDSTKALFRAMRMYTSGGFRRKVNELSGNDVEMNAMWSLENAVSQGKAPQYKGLLDKLKEFGFLQTSTARDATISAKQAQSSYGGTTRLHYLTNLAGTFMFHHAERMNREVTAIAAYDLEKAKLQKQGLSKEVIEERATDKAIRAVETMHGAGHTVTGPSLGHSNLGKVLMVFKRFAFSMYYMLFDTMRRALPVKGAKGEQLEGIRAARRQLAGMYGMSFLFAGAKGLPMYWVGEMAYNAFLDDDDDDFDTEMRRFLGDLGYKGPVNYFTNFSIADRVGWSDLIFREGKGDKNDASALTSYLEGMLGAPYAIVDNAFRAKSLMDDGHYERAVETLLPIAMRNVLKGIRYGTEGVNTLRGDPVMGEISGLSAGMQVLGFAPADLSARYMDIEYAKKKDKTLITMRDKLARQYYIAQGEGDFERADEVRDKLFAFGDKHPELGIDEKFLERSVKARDRISEDLFHGVTLSKRLRDSLVEDAEEFK